MPSDQLWSQIKRADSSYRDCTVDFVGISKLNCNYMFGNIQLATLSLKDCILFQHSNDLHSGEINTQLTTFHSLLSFEVLSKYNRYGSKVSVTIIRYMNETT